MSVLKKITNILSWVIIAFLVILIIFVMAAKANNKVPKIFGYGMLKLISGSMEPTYMTDDYILIKSVEKEPLKEGDVIAFYSIDPHIMGKINTHRIVEIKDNGEMVTKGDNNSSVDRTTVTKDRVVGKVIKQFPVMTFLGRWLGKTWVIITIVCLAVGGLIAQNAYVFFKNRKNKDAEEDEIDQDSIN